MINLRNNKFEGDYDSNFQEDIDESFFIPALMNSKRYDRMAGFFTSGSLAVTAIGIAGFIRNNGKMRLLTSPYISSSDKETLSKYTADSPELSEIIGLLMLNQLTQEFIENQYTEALGWMLMKGFLEIRIVLIKDENGNILSAEDYDNIGLFHNKVGILYDECDNIVVFSGSINATANAHSRNIEQFDVHCNWLDDPERHIKPKQKSFEAYWNLNGTKGTFTMELPAAVSEKWFKELPKEMEDLKILHTFPKTIHPHDYQIEAIDAWFNNGCIGLFNMATGTGKTYTAIFAVRKLLDQIKEPAILVVSVPNTHLIENPWINSMKKVMKIDGPEVEIIKAMGNSKEWNSCLIQAKMNLRMGKTNLIIILTTYDAFCSQKFTDFVQTAKGQKILIADEVHNVGSSETRKGLLKDYNCRLGLSATPERYLDDEGTNVIQSYFKNEVFTFTLEKAINTINPLTGKTFLTPYYYYPIFVKLTDKELENYATKSKIIARYGDISKLSEEEKLKRQTIILQRAKIIQDASNKISTFRELLPVLKEKKVFDHCLVYCASGKGENDERFLESVIALLNENGVRCRRFTSEDKTEIRTNNPLSDEEDRKTILKKFADGSLDALVAIKCLDEGVDVPATKNAIIMASTGNPREYIQRRGRILRRFPGKEYAILYDFFIEPGSVTSGRESNQNIFDIEYKRFKEFADLSINKEENYKLMQQIINKSNLRVNRWNSKLMIWLKTR